MNGDHDMMELIGAALIFVCSHFALSAYPVRSRLIAKIGERFFTGLYFIVAGLTMWWMLRAYGAAPRIELWQAPIAFRHVAVSVMPLVCILLVAGYTSGNPTAVGFAIFKGLERGPHGIFRITRHPILWGIILWAMVHMLANATAPDFVLFSSMALLSVGGAWHMDKRKSIELGDAWDAYIAETSSIPFVAVLDGRQRFVLSEIRVWRIAAGLLLYVGLLMVHKTAIGVSPLPMP